jgi:hypothetical protein
MTQVGPTPKILQVDMSGLPQDWLSIEDAITYYAKDMVLFELGNPFITYRGGFNRFTEAQSEITANSIIAIKRSIVRRTEIERAPQLTNEKLFERDRYICAYCGNHFNDKELSREHIKPVCQHGEDTWMNVVSACKYCNSEKGGRNLEQSRMTLLYLPYVPDRYESFILEQGTRHILADQMEFLLRKVPRTSRLKIN